MNAAPAEQPHLEPAEFEFREGESVRVDLVAGDTRVPMIIRMKPGGQLEMALIDPDQAWFWTEQWRAGEREADEDIAAGRGEVYEDADEFLDSFGTQPDVKRVQGTSDVWEMSWAPDGRATFGYGDDIMEGQPHIVWRRVGTHDVFRRP